ncbi:MAG: DUF4157 domain-containing protein [Pseudanabaena sp.]
MGHTNDRSTKASSLVNPTSLNLQPRPFAPLESDEKDEAISHKSGYSENFLEKIINTPRSESATPIQRKPENRLKAIATERNNASLQNQSIQRQEAAEDEKSEGEQEGGKEFIMNPEPPPVQRKFENRLRAKNAQRMAIQTKLAIGEPNDKYEQEADATAARVVQQINSPITTQSQPVQRKFENRLRAKNAQKMALQPKLAIGEPNDKYEQEADATAARVVQQINSSIPSQSLPIQRQEMEEDEELQMKPLVQRSENIGGGEASTDLESAIQSARGSGQSLDANLQHSMGQAMGADFSGVKVHTDSQSDQLNKSIQAKAFTTGQDLFFRQGAYEPSSRGGQELIAHELTHVVQQNGGAVQRKVTKGKGGQEYDHFDRLLNEFSVSFKEKILSNKDLTQGLQEIITEDRLHSIHEVMKWIEYLLGEIKRDDCNDIVFDPVAEEWIAPDDMDMWERFIQSYTKSQGKMRLTYAQFEESAAKKAEKEAESKIPIDIENDQQLQSLWGSSAGIDKKERVEAIKQMFEESGYKVVDIVESTKSSSPTPPTLFNIEKHPTIAKFEIHPGGGIHKAPYIRISTQKGMIKVINKNSIPPYDKLSEKAVKYVEVSK